MGPRLRASLNSAVRHKLGYTDHKSTVWGGGGALALVLSISSEEIVKHNGTRFTEGGITVFVKGWERESTPLEINKQ